MISPNAWVANGQKEGVGGGSIGSRLFQRGTWRGGGDDVAPPVPVRYSCWHGGVGLGRRSYFCFSLSSPGLAVSSHAHCPRYVKPMQADCFPCLHFALLPVWRSLFLSRVRALSARQLYPVRSGLDPVERAATRERGRNKKKTNNNPKHPGPHCNSSRFDGTRGGGEGRGAGGGRPVRSTYTMVSYRRRLPIPKYYVHTNLSGRAGWMRRWTLSYPGFHGSHG